METKVTLVTGGAKGIGKGCVDVFARNCSKVVFCDKDDDNGKKTEAELNSKYPNHVMFIHCDITDEEGIKKMMTTIAEKFGRLDTLVNNAGWHPGFQPIDKITKTDLENLLEINLVGPFMVSKYALPHLRKVKGSIVNISSMSGVHGEHNSSAYCTTKGGVSAMTRALAIDESRHGVRVNSVAPAVIRTPLFESWVQSFENPEEKKKTASSWMCLGRLGTVEEVGKACYYLANDATFSTGVQLLVDGGSNVGYGVKA